MQYSDYLIEKIAECTQLYNLGATTNDLVESLHDQGLSLNEVCKVVAAVLEIEPAEAHIFVADNPIWIEVVDQSSPVVEEIMQVLGRDGKVEDLGDGVVVFRETLVTDALANVGAQCSVS
jgi:hypothetical protein